MSLSEQAATLRRITAQRAATSLPIISACLHTVSANSKFTLPPEQTYCKSMLCRLVSYVDRGERCSANVNMEAPSTSAKVSDLDGSAPESTDYANYFCTYAYLYHQVCSFHRCTLDLSVWVCIPKTQFAPANSFTMLRVLREMKVACAAERHVGGSQADWRILCCNSSE